jgi:hypothetical protein
VPWWGFLAVGSKKRKNCPWPQGIRKLDKPELEKNGSDFRLEVPAPNSNKIEMVNKT